MQNLERPITEPIVSFLGGGHITPETVLFEVWRPIVFTVRSLTNQTLLAYLADETEEGDWYFLAPISSPRLIELQKGALSLRDALTSSWMWQCIDQPNGNGLKLWSVDPADIPDIFLPIRGTPLLPEHDSMLVTRAIGDTVKLGHIPSSVISFVSEATRGALKVLLDYVSDSSSTGRPPQHYRQLYDLPVQRFAFQSFEVSFGAPDTGLFPNEILTAAIGYLEKSLEWASATGSQELNEESPQAREAMLRAALLLTPPSGGAISQVNVSGCWMNHKEVVLGAHSRRKVKAELRALNMDHVELSTGKIREVDRDLLSLILRDANNALDRKCFFAINLLDDVIQYFGDETTVTVSGMENAGRFEIALIGTSVEGGKNDIGR